MLPQFWHGFANIICASAYFATLSEIYDATMECLVQSRALALVVGEGVVGVGCNWGLEDILGLGGTLD